MTAVNINFDKVVKLLNKLGFLLLSGDEIPSVRLLLTGQKSKGSWWADPAARQIFAVTQLLENHPDVAIARMVSKKVTFVHRELWTQLFAIAAARDQWQLQGLSSPAMRLLKQIDAEGMLLTNTLRKSAATKLRDAARELELRLLIHSDQFHTESGAHAKRLQTWDSWATRVRLKNRSLNSTDARSVLEERLKRINETFSGRGSLPWQ